MRFCNTTFSWGNLAKIIFFIRKIPFLKSTLTEGSHFYKMVVVIFLLETL